MVRVRAVGLGARDVRATEDKQNKWAGVVVVGSESTARGRGNPGRAPAGAAAAACVFILAGSRGAS